jgi:exosome complex component RRP42
MDSQKTYFLKLLAEGRRLDGRKIDDIREPLKVEYGISKTAEGSAKVTLGDTEILVGVKMEVSTPYPDAPDKGTIMVGAELIPLSSRTFEPGPPTIQAVELARVVDRGIRESKALDFKKLCITEGEKCWIVIIDIVTLNDDGGLFDAAALGVLAALKDAKFPAYDGTKIDYKTPDKPLEIEKSPIAVTVFKVGEFFIVDPTKEEEKEMDARLTVTTDENGSLCALQKGGESALSTDEVGKMIDIALDKSKIYRGAL